MTKLKKKGKEGTAAEYITRNRALKKLQLSPHDFRRLCILKGIYPRDPKHKNKITRTARHKSTIYLLKDIRFLSHEPLLAKFRALKAFHKKIKKYVGKRAWAKIQSLEKNVCPEIRLDHLVRERYPSFVDALRDLDDPLSMVALFANLPRTTDQHQADTSSNCEKLLREFEAYVIATGSLKKAFISIKGIYYQANIMGQTVTWVVPHEFTTPVPTNVDYNVMLTFLEFYLVLIRFVNYRLFTRLGWEYPPSFINEGQEVLLKSTFPKIVCVDEIFPNGDQRILSDAKVFVSREVPKKSLTFVLQCLGAEVSYAAEDRTPPVAEDDLSLTHQIIDRPSLHRLFVNRQYIQPQWVFDSLNAANLVDMTNYYIGAKLPSHLSPFITETNDDNDDDEEMEDEVKETVEESQNKETVEENKNDGIIKQTTTQQSAKKPKSQTKEKQMQKELAISLLSKKRRRLYRKMQYSRQKQAKERKQLEAKRKKIVQEAQK